ncbi:MAG: hypothetical protein KA914_13675 [Ottowia sp.]|jgi:hypothetical protein|nr:hypothetical protein [Ottowia sp.]
MSRIVNLHEGRIATQLGIDGRPAEQATRLLCTQYWRRQHLVNVAGHRLDALDVFDTSIVQALVVIKEYLLHDATSFNALLHRVREVEHELKAPAATAFATTCIGALMVQLSRGGEIDLWLTIPEVFARHPMSVADGLRFCFDTSVAGGLANALQGPNRSQSPAGLENLCIAMGIARPAISDHFARLAADVSEKMPGGAAALCRWRCTGNFDSVQSALASLNDPASDTDAALYALQLMGSSQALNAARTILARTASLTALAICAARATSSTRDDMRAGKFLHLGFERLCYLYALSGDWNALLAVIPDVDWSNEGQCRALADGVSLVSGTLADYLFDMSRPGDERSTRLLTTADSLALPADQPIRLGQPMANVLLENSAPAVGAPLRQMLYVEYACKLRVPVFIDAADVAGVQGLAVSTASAWERMLVERASP